MAAVTPTMTSPAMFPNTSNEMPVNRAMAASNEKALTLAEVEKTISDYGFQGLIEVSSYDADLRIKKLVPKIDEWDKLCLFHEIIKQNLRVFDDRKKLDLEIALYKKAPDLYQWLIR